jgi:predicted metalloprotease with PDZ domain
MIAVPFIEAWAKSQSEPNSSIANLSKYELTFNENNVSQVNVTASIRVSKEKIRMLSYGHPWLKNGWATFVQDLEIKQENGSSLSPSVIEENGWGAWHVGVPDGTRVTLSYTVNLDHINFDWNKAGGRDSRPEWKNGALFAISRAFFIYSFIDEESEVTVNYPKNWALITPWEKVVNKPNTFYIPSKESLVSNLFVLGEFEKRVAKFEGMTIQFAIDKTLTPYSSKLEAMLQKQLEYYSHVFGGAPNVKFAIGIRAADEDDGEAFVNSFNQVIEESTLSKENSNVIWANTLAHEMFHFWNGSHALKSDKKEDTYWFIEGFTEYYASFTLHKQSEISTKIYLKKLEKYLGRYFISSHMWPEQRITLKEAGKDKNKNWLRLYGGGAVIALALDIDIYTNSNGQQSLNSLMRELNNKYGAPNVYISNESILKTLNAMTGRSYDTFFNEYILSENGYLDITPYLDKVGLELLQRVDEFYLSVKDNVKFNQFVERKAFQ